jgi:hypothetical protein
MSIMPSSSSCTAVIAGLDGDAGHIYLIDDPGDYICCDSEGFAAIDLGREHAESVFTESMYTDRTPWRRPAEGRIAELAKSGI